MGEIVDNIDDMPIAAAPEEQHFGVAVRIEKASHRRNIPGMRRIPFQPGANLRGKKRLQPAPFIDLKDANWLPLTESERQAHTP